MGNLLWKRRWGGGIAESYLFKTCIYFYISLKCFHLSFSSFQQLATSKTKFGYFMFSKLPSAWVCGVRVRELDEQHCVVSVPYKWLSQNPFKSIYFACQAMAAEMSTGLLSMGHSHET